MASLGAGEEDQRWRDGGDAQPSSRAGRVEPRLGQALEIGDAKRELPTSVYRVDPSGKVTLVARENEVPDPNGLVLSPDYKKLYVISTGEGPGDTGPGGKREMYVIDVGSDNKLSNRKLFSDFMIEQSLYALYTPTQGAAPG